MDKQTLCRMGIHLSFLGWKRCRVSMSRIIDKRQTKGSLMSERNTNSALKQSIICLMKFYDILMKCLT